jgi:DNA-binding transcriptional ArsR family regulator
MPKKPACVRPPLDARPLMSGPQALGLAAVFKVLANDTRLRLLHALARGGEVSVTGLAGAVGMRPQAVSNQLRRLLDGRIVAARREGTSILYRVVNGCVVGILDQGWCLTEGGGCGE